MFGVEHLPRYKELIELSKEEEKYIHIREFSQFVTKTGNHEIKNHYHNISNWFSKEELKAVLDRFYAIKKEEFADSLRSGWCVLSYGSNEGGMIKMMECLNRQTNKRAFINPDRLCVEFTPFTPNSIKESVSFLFCELLLREAVENGYAFGAHFPDKTEEEMAKLQEKLVFQGYQVEVFTNP